LLFVKFVEIEKTTLSPTELGFLLTDRWISRGGPMEGVAVDMAVAEGLEGAYVEVGEGVIGADDVALGVGLVRGRTWT
jgi:hypothetical protein